MTEECNFCFEMTNLTTYVVINVLPVWFLSPLRVAV